MSRTWDIDQLSVDLMNNQAMVRITSQQRAPGEDRDYVGITISFNALVSVPKLKRLLKRQAADLMREAAAALTADADAEDRTIIP